MMHSTHAIDGLEPLAVVQPATIADLSQAVVAAAAAGHAVYPVGGRTMMHLGLPPRRPGIALDLRRLAAVVDYPARDMTITVEAGITLAELQAILEHENQRLPIDVPCPVLATLGGAIACNAGTVMRFGYGGFRDYVIGITVVNADGRETRAGGRVVKNVAGYDLCKLHVGALGTLGVITQATLKVRPMPECTALAAFAVRSPGFSQHFPPEGGTTSGELGRMLDLLHESRTRPCACAVLNARGAVLLPALAKHTSKQWCILVGYEGNRESVLWQLSQLEQEIARAGASTVLIWRDADAAPPWRALADFPLVGCVASFKAVLLPSAVARFCCAADALGAALLADAGSGMVVGLLDGDWASELSAAMGQLRLLAVASCGSLIVTRCPPAWKSAANVWGEPRGDWPLMRLIKRKLDPRSLFNPGRLFPDL